MEQKEKRSQASLGQYRGSNHGGGGSAKRPWKRVRSSVAMFLTVTNIDGSEIAAQFENSDDHRHLCCMSEEFDPSDYSFVVKRRGSPAKPWRWEIHRAGRSGLVECSPGFF